MLWVRAVGGLGAGVQLAVLGVAGSILGHGLLALTRRPIAWLSTQRRFGGHSDWKVIRVDIETHLRRAESGFEGVRSFLEGPTR